MGDLEQRMGSRELSEWRAWFSMAESPSPEISPPEQGRDLSPDELAAQLEAMFGRGKRKSRE